MLGRTLNVLTKPFIGIGIIELWELSSQTKLTKKKVEELVLKKQLRDAVRITSKLLGGWSNKPSFLERLIRNWLLGNILNELEKQLRQWRKSLSEADSLYREASILQQSDTGNPLEADNLIKAISIYERYIAIIREGNSTQVIDDLKQEVAKRQQFQKLFNEGKTYSLDYYFKDAARVYELAQKLYDIDIVQQAIKEAKEHFEEEEVYLVAFHKAQQACINGDFQQAYRVLPNVLKNFPRPEGMSFFEKVKKIIKGKEKFQEGLQAERNGYLEMAASLYANSQALIPEHIDREMVLARKT